MNFILDINICLNVPTGTQELIAKQVGFYRYVYFKSFGIVMERQRINTDYIPRKRLTISVGNYFLHDEASLKILLTIGNEGPAIVKYINLI